jgi:peroxiredoxin
MPRSSERRADAAISGTLACCLVLGACATTSEARPTRRAPIDLTLASVDGHVITLAQQRGTPLIVFLFATYDGNSQLALTHLEVLLQREPRLRALGIALQPDAGAFLEPYRAALSITFPLAHDPEGSVLAGESVLGKIASVPGFVAIDAHGAVRAIRYGVLTPSQLHELVADSLAP